MAGAVGGPTLALGFVGQTGWIDQNGSRLIVVLAVVWFLGSGAVAGVLWWRGRSAVTGEQLAAAEPDSRTTPAAATLPSADASRARTEADVVGDLNDLYRRGEQVLGKFAGMIYPYGDGPWRVATLAYQDWVDAIAVLIEADRPIYAPRFEGLLNSRLPAPLVELKSADGISESFGMNAEYKKRIKTLAELLAQVIRSE